MNAPDFYKLPKRDRDALVKAVHRTYESDPDTLVYSFLSKCSMDDLKGFLKRIRRKKIKSS